MILTRFSIESIARKDGMSTYYRGLDFTKKLHMKEFLYTITGNDGNTYHLHSYRTKVRLTTGQELRCFVSGNGQDRRYRVEYSRPHGGYFMSKYMFEKALENEVRKCREYIERHDVEITRLEKLKDPSPEKS